MHAYNLVGAAKKLIYALEHTLKNSNRPYVMFASA